MCLRRRRAWRPRWLLELGGRLMKVLDLCCREGGAADGYRQAGASVVVGVDTKRVRNYPGTLFIQGDALALSVDFIRQFDLVHASPPCQFGTEMNNDKSKHLNLIPDMRRLLLKAGKPYVIENVRKVAAEHLIRPTLLTGTMFDLHMITSTGRRYDLERTRGFETNWPLFPPWDPGAQHPIANVFGGHLRCRDKEHRTGKGTGRTVDFPGEDRPALARQLMGMPWASMSGMGEAVPPAFTRFIGEEFLAHLNQQRAAA